MQSLHLISSAALTYRLNFDYNYMTARWRDLTCSDKRAGWVSFKLIPDVVNELRISWTEWNVDASAQQFQPDAISCNNVDIRIFDTKSFRWTGASSIQNLLKHTWITTSLVHDKNV